MENGVGRILSSGVQHWYIAKVVLEDDDGNLLLLTYLKAL